MNAEERVLVVTGTHKPDGRPDAETQFEWFFAEFFTPTVAVLGCAGGVDKRARLYFRRIGIRTVVKVAIWRRNNIFNPYAGHDRNQKMIDEAPRTAHLLALPLLLPSRDPDWTHSPGTLDCYKRGRTKGLICHIR